MFVGQYSRPTKSGDFVVHMTSAEVRCPSVAFSLNVFQAEEIKSVVEKQMRSERAEFERRQAEYERMVSDLRAECRQLAAEAEKVLQLLQQFLVFI